LELLKNVSHGFLPAAYFRWRTRDTLIFSCAPVDFTVLCDTVCESLSRSSRCMVWSCGEWFPSGILVCGSSNRSQRVRRNLPFLLPDGGGDAGRHVLGHAHQFHDKSAEFWRIVRQIAGGLDFRVKGGLSSATDWYVVFLRGYGWAPARRK
jgi:hypothetical protein